MCLPPLPNENGCRWEVVWRKKKIFASGTLLIVHHEGHNVRLERDHGRKMLMLLLLCMEGSGRSGSRSAEALGRAVCDLMLQRDVRGGHRETPNKHAEHVTRRVSKSLEEEATERQDPKKTVIDSLQSRGSHQQHTLNASNSLFPSLESWNEEQSGNVEPVL